MLEILLGSKSKERVLLYLTARKEGFAREIVRFYETDLTPIQNQLIKLESGGILISKNVGRTRLYSFNPRYPFIAPLNELLLKAIEFLPQEEKDNLTVFRSRPRRAGKPL
jgi:predicted transcriptional regulator